MYYRIELINEYPLEVQRKENLDRGIPYHECKRFEAFKEGLYTVTNDEVYAAWIDDIKGPTNCAHIPRNCRFFFTEEGFDKVGRKVIAACIRTKQKYRVIRVKNNEWEVVWRGRLEAALRPKKGNISKGWKINE